MAVQALAAAACAVTALAVAPGASAHARLVATRPEQGAVLPSAPATVTFTFDEAVRSAARRRWRVTGSSTSSASPTRLESGNRVLVARLPARVPDGDYTVTWRVASDDGHLETGALSFGVGVGTPAPGAVVSQRTARDAR